jgi:hypothetical protein
MFRPQPGETHDHDRFPRSATMRLLLNGKSGTVAGIALGALLLAKLPAARQLLRMLPAGAIVRLLLAIPRGGVG